MDSQPFDSLYEQAANIARTAADSTIDWTRPAFTDFAKELREKWLGDQLEFGGELGCRGIVVLANVIAIANNGVVPDDLAEAAAFAELLGEKLVGERLKAEFDKLNEQLRRHAAGDDDQIESPPAKDLPIRLPEAQNAVPITGNLSRLQRDALACRADVAFIRARLAQIEAAEGR